jgi:Zn-dependent peptidase ImmA (M78 family)/transcriptional regulator with XRE-family HTH domain
MPTHRTPGFTGSRLREAREARGLSAASLAEVVGLSRQVISQYEHGQTAPTPDRLYLIAAKLNLPVAFFLQPPRAATDRTVFFRSLAAATKGERAKAESRLDWLEDLVGYLEGFVEFPTASYPDLGAWARSGGTWSPREIDSVAVEIRRQWNAGDGPIGNMIGLLESRGGIATRGIVETETIDAFSVRLDSNHRPAFFLGADKDSAARSRFDAAHELGHHVLHAAVKPKRLMNALERKAVEREAHQFASAFLLPASEFARDLRAPTLDGMRIAKSRWAVSIGAMIQRCVDLEILRSHEAERLWIARAKRGWVRQEPLDDELPMEQPTLLRKAIELVVLEGEGTRAQILRDLPLGAADIEALGGLPAGYFAEEGAPVRLLARRPNSGQDQGETGQIIEFPGDD